jgi:hypothetical protein
VRRSRSRSTVTKDGVTCPSCAFIARRDSFGVWDLALPVCANSGFRGSTAEVFGAQPTFHAPIDGVAAATPAFLACTQFHAESPWARTPEMVRLSDVRCKKRLGGVLKHYFRKAA